MGCFKCSTNYYLYNGSCFSSCSNIGTGYVEDITTGVCIKCGANCNKCSASNISICLSCSAGFTLSENGCIGGATNSGCPSGT